MPVLHYTSTWNIEATINRHFRDILPTITRPSYLATMPTIVENMPETTIVAPAFSFVHIPAGSRQLWHGNRVSDTEKGVKSLAIFEVSCWVSRKLSTSWNVQLRVMQGMVEYVYMTANDGLQVRDYAGSPTVAAHTPYLVRLQDLEWVATVPDANPDYERRRGLISYHWIHRSF